jgi:hypothetical protein
MSCMNCRRLHAMCALHWPRDDQTPLVVLQCKSCGIEFQFHKTTPIELNLTTARTKASVRKTLLRSQASALGKRIVRDDDGSETIKRFCMVDQQDDDMSAQTTPQILDRLTDLNQLMYAASNTAETLVVHPELLTAMWCKCADCGRYWEPNMTAPVYYKNADISFTQDISSLCKQCYAANHAHEAYHSAFTGNYCFAEITAPSKISDVIRVNVPPLFTCKDLVNILEGTLQRSIALLELQGTRIDTNSKKQLTCLDCSNLRVCLQ